MPRATDVHARRVVIVEPRPDLCDVSLVADDDDLDGVLGHGGAADVVDIQPTPEQHDLIAGSTAFPGHGNRLVDAAAPSHHDPSTGHGSSVPMGVSALTPRRFSERGSRFHLLITGITL